MPLSKLKQISSGIDCKIPYGRTMLHVLVKTGLECQKADSQKIIMKRPRLVAWRCKYLINVHKYHEDGNLIVYLDETCFVYMILFDCFVPIVQKVLLYQNHRCDENEW